MGVSLRGVHARRQTQTRLLRVASALARSSGGLGKYHCHGRSHGGRIRLRQRSAASGTDVQARTGRGDGTTAWVSRPDFATNCGRAGGVLSPMTRTLLAFAIVPCLASIASLPQARPKNIWERQYKDRTAVDMATQFESEGRPVYRHRRDIIKLLDLAPGLTVAEIGAGSGFLSRLAGRDVGPGGRVIATELDPKMVAYMNDRAKAEGLSNVRAIQGRVDGCGLDPQ